MSNIVIYTPKIVSSSCTPPGFVTKYRHPRFTAAGPGSLCTLLALGAVLAVMNTAFYLAVNRLPLSTVGAIEFLSTSCLPFRTSPGSPW
jgi:threonine/homoserine efflux transporter RhtA